MHRSPFFIGIMAGIILLFPACSSRKLIRKKLSISQKALSHPSSDNPPITIWIHGTRMIRRPLFHSFFNSVPSLRLGRELAPDYYLHSVCHMLNAVAPDMFPLETFYLFGWSGKLRASVRQEAAIALYHEIQHIVTRYKKTYQTDPIIRVITHSHGGAVALNLAKIRDENPEFTIHELVLMACPVQAITQQYINDPLFERIYALYSSLDVVQVLAPQVVYNIRRTKKGHLRSKMCWPPFSQKRFAHHPKMSQVKMKINGRALFHSEFATPRFVAMLPHIIHVMKSWHTTDNDDESTHLLCVSTKEEIDTRPHYC